ncbi:MAG TPA: Hsp70 family protein [Devosia sp.]|nr:Hsp70 family protein [Devosia sp.]
MHCGLDFGTSNSTLGTALPGRPARLLPLEDGRPTIPSAIFFSFEDSETYYGRRAQREYTAGTDGRFMRALKSILGTALIEENIRIRKDVIPFAEIVGMFVGELKRRAEADLADGLDHVVAGRPVHFVDDDPVADRRAQQQLEAAIRGQGFRHIEFQFEPIAAALDYESRINGEELGLVIDLGGGTSDFSVVRVSPERVAAADRQGDILAAGGIHIGGTDFDRLLSMARAMPELGYRTLTADGKRPLPSGPYYDLASWHRINRLYNAQSLLEQRQTRREAAHPERVDRMISVIEHREGHRLAGAVEDAKIALTDTEAAEIRFAGEEVRLDLPVTRSQLANALEASIERIARTVEATLRDAGLTPRHIETLILTGGSTRIPAIMARLRMLFPEAKFVETDPFGSVGLGLAIDARRKFG